MKQNFDDTEEARACQLVSSRDSEACVDQGRQFKFVSGSSHFESFGTNWGTVGLVIEGAPFLATDSCRLPSVSFGPHPNQRRGPARRLASIPYYDEYRDFLHRRLHDLKL